MAINLSVVRVKTMILGRQSLKYGLWFGFSDQKPGVSMNRFIVVAILLLACGIFLFCLCAYNLLGPVDRSSPAEETVFIGHEHLGDVTFARKMGMKTILYNAIKKVPSDANAKTLDQIPGLIRRLQL